MKHLGCFYRITALRCFVFKTTTIITKKTETFFIRLFVYAENKNVIFVIGVAILWIVVSVCIFRNPSAVLVILIHLAKYLLLYIGSSVKCLLLLKLNTKVCISDYRNVLLCSKTNLHGRTTPKCHDSGIYVRLNLIENTAGKNSNHLHMRWSCSHVVQCLYCNDYPMLAVHSEGLTNIVCH